MKFTRPVYAVFFVFLLCALAKIGFEGKLWKPQEFYADHGVVIKEEQEWIHCRKELIERNNDIKDYDLEIKTNLLDCITRTHPPTHDSEEKEHDHVSVSQFYSEDNRGRYLLDKLPQSERKLPRPVPVPSPKKLRVKKKFANSLPPQGITLSAISPSPNSPPIDFYVLFPPPPDSPPPPPPQVDEEDNSKRKIPIIIGSVVSGIIIIVGMLLCYREIRKSRKVYKDDRPLTVLGSSDVSGSKKSIALGNSNTNENGIIYVKNPSIVGNVTTSPEDNNASLGMGVGVGLGLGVAAGEASSSESKEQVPLGAAPEGLAPEPAGPPPPPPPPPAAAPRPPPAPKAPVRPPPAPPVKILSRARLSNVEEDSADAPKAKLKPFFWDKVAASPDQAMVWHEIRAGSFQFNEQKIESLFGCNNPNRKESPSQEPSLQLIQIIDPKKAQNLSILLRALNVTTEEVVDALREGSEIPVELIQTLIKMAPTTDEELKLRLFDGNIAQLGPAERFLKVLVDIPLAFRRLESLQLMLTLPEEVSSIKECFSTLEVSCDKLRKSRLFLKLLEAVLKTGNRLNDGTYRGGAQAFKLDTLLKLSDVKGTDGKTTLLHFVVQEIIRSEGVRALRTERARQSNSSVRTEDSVDDSIGQESEEHYRRLGLEVVSGLSSELEDVKRAAIIDGDALTAAVWKLDRLLSKSEELLNNDLKSIDEDSNFKRSLENFVDKSKAQVSWLSEEEKRIMAEVKATADYFHGQAGKDEGLRLFVIVRDFLVMLDTVCKEVQLTTQKPMKISHKKEASNLSSPPVSPNTQQQSPSDLHRRLFPAIAARRIHCSSSDEDEDEKEDDN
ncbi:formin-like protein 3 [Arachis hypogaea]|uniref:formin-like protein 3 n=1 Tax=Arachis hypogaea TaxID=3818 RepID=UPI000DEC8ABC|nr:Formin-like protein [Arachis hypogaea]